jgi:RHS repeat-associated protein
VAEPVAGPVTFTYNADGRRVEKETPSDTTRFVYDGNKVLQETDGSGSVEQQYLSTLEEWGELVSAYDGLETSTYHYDAIGTTDALLDESETATDRYRHRAFGLEQSQTGSSENPFTFVGREGYYRDEELALYLAGARYYDPAAGRWLSQDPIRFDGGDANLYRYVKNNPVNATDPSGLYDAAGHFYTTYIVVYIITRNQLDALELAYYSQLPDIEKDHEAVPQAINAGKAKIAKEVYQAKEAMKSIFGGRTDAAEAGMLILKEDLDIEYAQEINGILHALHGGKDVAKWQQGLKSFISRGKGRSLMELGYAIHAFGDSFAHTFINERGERQAFGWPEGHAPVIPSTEDVADMLARGNVRGFDKDSGHVPDIIAYDFENYKNYVEALAEAIASWHGVKIDVTMRAELDQFLAIVETEAADPEAKGDGGAFMRTVLFEQAKRKKYPLHEGASEPFLPHDNPRQTLGQFAIPDRDQVENFMDNIYDAIYPGEHRGHFIEKTFRRRSRR